jgi:hypothetical protein
MKKHPTMRLNLALHGILVASATIDESKCKDDFYLQAVQQQLLLKNKDIIGQIPAKPFFYIEVPASAASIQFRKTADNKAVDRVKKSNCLGCGKACKNAGDAGYMSAA